MTDQKQQNTTETKTSYSLAPAVLSSKIEDGGEYVLIKRGFGSQPAQVFSTGDNEETLNWLRMISLETEPA